MFIGGKKRGGSLSSSGKVSSGKFLGLDSSMSGNTVSSYRADDCVNMIRTAMGEVSKRAGYKAYSAPVSGIGGVHTFASPDGDKLFFVSGHVITVTDLDYNVQVSFGLPCPYDDCFSVQSGKYMMFLNGDCLAAFDTERNVLIYVRSNGETSITSPDDAYTPTVFIASSPAGGGESYEAVNLFNPFVAEQYISDGDSLSYTLHFDSNGGGRAYIKDENGEWQAATVTLSGNTATFDTAPPLPPVEGEDNVRIIYKRKSFADNAIKIAGCRCGTLYGVSGYKDRVFVSANKALRGYVYYSDMDDPLYFPDLNYIRVGSNDTEVMGLAGQDTSLAVICSDNVYTLSGGMTDDGAVFAVSGIFKTPKPPCVQKPQVFDGEVVYLTEDGVCAITASGVLDERFCQIRSAFLNHHLKKEELSDCILVETDEFLVISNRKGTLFLLDGKQFSTAGDLPFSHRQYEGYIWNNVHAKYLWQQEGRLCFSDGELIFSFNRGFKSNNEYRDETSIADGVPVTETITAYWETPYIYCSNFHLIKFFMRMGLLIDSGYGADGERLNTDVKISARFDNDDWRTVKDYCADHRLFRYGNISYPRFTYRDRPKSYAIYRRLWHKRGRGLKLRFENDKFDEPFTLQEFCVEYNIM